MRVSRGCAPLRLLSAFSASIRHNAGLTRRSPFPPLDSYVGLESALCEALIFACSQPLSGKRSKLQHNVVETMAPSLESPHPKIDLIESAVKCERQLDSLRKYAHDRKDKYTGKKHALLLEVITRSNSNIQSLKAWTAAISRGRQTSDENIRASINAVFENIVSRKKDAQKALDHRLALKISLEKRKYDIAQGCTWNCR